MKLPIQSQPILRNVSTGKHKNQLKAQKNYDCGHCLWEITKAASSCFGSRNRGNCIKRRLRQRSGIDAEACISFCLEDFLG